MPDRTTESIDDASPSGTPTREPKCPQAGALSSEQGHSILAGPSDTCGLPTPVCPHFPCKGAPLVLLGDEHVCERCHARWPMDVRSPCPDRPSVILRLRGSEKDFIVCGSHAARLEADKPRDIFIHGVRRGYGH